MCFIVNDNIWQTIFCCSNRYKVARSLNLIYWNFTKHAWRVNTSVSKRVVSGYYLTLGEHFFKLCHNQIKLRFGEMIMISLSCLVLDQQNELDFYSAYSLKQQSTDRYGAQLGNIILIPNRPGFFPLMLNTSRRSSKYQML